jgi:hypothetical protein
MTEGFRDNGPHATLSHAGPAARGKLDISLKERNDTRSGAALEISIDGIDDARIVLPKSSAIDPVKRFYE